MKLPNAPNAVVDLRKLTEYALNIEHERGKHKARLFQAFLGLGVQDAPALREALLDAAHTLEAEDRGSYGRSARYMIEFRMTWKERQALVRSVWEVREGEDFPRLVTCLPMRERT